MKLNQEQLHPQARTEGLIIQELSDEALVYDLHRHKAHCLNQTAAALWRQCDGKKNIAEIAAQMDKQYDATLREEVIRLGLQQLADARLLEDPLPAFGSRMSRREVMRRAGMMAAVGIPIVTSILAPRAAQAASCRANGEGCNGNGQCCSHNCTGGICV